MTALTAEGQDRQTCNGRDGQDRGNPEIGGLSSGSSVLAMVPHYRCERWLADCLESLVAQERPLQGIAVIDDGSSRPPLDIVRAFPQVTLLASPTNVGPFRLMQSLIEATRYDAYLFQDADDWSSPRRLGNLLAESERRNAGLVGSRVVRIDLDQDDAVPLYLPLDGNAALASYPAVYPVLLGSCIVSRRLVRRLGGFATGLRFGADPEFVRRAAHVTRVVNAPSFDYFYRKRPASLTGASSSGMDAPDRVALVRDLHARAEANAARVTRGDAPDLTPYAVAAPVRLAHLIGPGLVGMLDDSPSAT